MDLNKPNTITIDDTVEKNPEATVTQVDKTEIPTTNEQIKGTQEDPTTQLTPITEANWVCILNSKYEDNKNIIEISGLTEHQRDLIGNYLVSLKNTTHTLDSNIMVNITVEKYRNLKITLKSPISKNTHCSHFIKKPLLVPIFGQKNANSVKTTQYFGSKSR